MTSHRRHLVFWSSTSQLVKTSPTQHVSIDRLSLSRVWRERRADDVTVTSFPVLANQHGNWPPTIECTCLACTETKSIACLLESPKTCSFCVYDVSMTKHVIRNFGTFQIENRKRYRIGILCTASTQWGQTNDINKIAKITTSVFDGHLGF